MMKVCVICGAEFAAQRSTAKYCSNRCKMQARRLFLKPDLGAPHLRFAVTLDEAAKVVQDAHRVTDDMSRTGERAPEPLGGKLRRCAEGFADVLGREGL